MTEGQPCTEREPQQRNRGRPGKEADAPGTPANGELSSFASRLSHHLRIFTSFLANIPVHVYCSHMLTHLYSGTVLSPATALRDGIFLFISVKMSQCVYLAVIYNSYYP